MSNSNHDPASDEESFPSVVGPTQNEANENDDSDFQLDAASRGPETRGASVGEPEIQEANSEASSKGREEIEYPPVGRYEVLDLLGQGGFGCVLLAEDPTLKRRVAIKVPIPEKYESNHAWDSFIHEARAVANLKHDAIIQVFDIDSNEDGIPFVVMEYVEGQTLKELGRKGSMTISDSLNVVREIAQGLAHAHQHSIVHRDLKPSNIMIDRNGRVKIADFGLAFYDNIPQARIANSVAGTLGYMAPEQLRGENHRLDGRTDIWALGITMYWMFCGQLPFRGGSIKEFIKEIALRVPKPIRQINPCVPPDVERVCNKCLRPLMSERYQSAADLIDDLDFLINGSAHPDVNSASSFSAQPVGAEVHESAISASNATNRGSTVISDPKVVPKGLRAFDTHDSEFYPLLLPGPKDRYGIPDSIRFWTHKLRDPENELPVGLIYGPSGCGKTSFIRAGVLPRLGNEIQTAYIECSRNNTEKDIVRKLSKFLHADSSVENVGVMDLFREMRRGNRPLRKQSKVLVVLDQFEQWLHENGADPDAELIHALRQCDGLSIQCLISVRDDYWMSAHDFFERLESPVQDGVNSIAVQLLNERHSREVLTLFGRAYGAFPDEDLSRPQLDFVHESVAGLADKGKVVCAHLSLFSEIVKDRPWTKSELSRLGGWEGVSFRYLEESFGEDSRLIQYRADRPIVEQVLKSLLPPLGTSIKGASRSRTQLIEDCSHLGKPKQTERLLGLLDQKLRLVAKSEFAGEPNSTESEYQLGHDTLVQPVTNWLTFRQKSTWQGRAKLRLEELTKRWVQTGESRNLPGPLEYFRILFSGEAGKRNDEQRRFIRASHRRYGLIAASALALFALFATFYRIEKVKRLRKDIASQIEAFVDAEPDASSLLLQDLVNRQNLTVLQILDARQEDESSRSQMRLEILRACLSHGSSDFDALMDEMRKASTDEVDNFGLAVQKLAQDEGRAPGEMLQERFDESKDRIEKARIAILNLRLGNRSSLKACANGSPDLQSSVILQLPSWHGGMQQLFEHLDDTSSLEHYLACCGLALIDPLELTRSDLNAASKYLHSVFEDASAANGVHFAAKLALERWGIDKKNVTNGVSFKSVAVTNDLNMDFVKILPDEVPLGAGDSRYQYYPGFFEGVEGGVDNQFWIAGKEVGTELFFEFLKSEMASDESREYFKRIPPEYLEHDLAIYGANWYESIQFCNWASEKVGRSPVYSETKKGIWEADKEANGFRLASYLEWELACRAGGSTTYFWGSQELAKYVNVFAWDDSSEGELGDDVVGGKRGGKLPNAFGLFDIAGNVSEWTSGPFRPDPTKPVTMGPVMKGGSAKAGRLADFRSARVIRYPASFRSDESGGIRLVLDEVGP